MLGIASKVERDKGILCGRQGPHERAGPDAEMAIVEKGISLRTLHVGGCGRWKPRLR